MAATGCELGCVSCFSPENDLGTEVPVLILDGFSSSIQAGALPRACDFPVFVVTPYRSQGRLTGGMDPNTVWCVLTAPPPPPPPRAIDRHSIIGNGT